MVRTPAFKPARAVSMASCASASGSSFGDRRVNLGSTSGNFIAVFSCTRNKIRLVTLLSVPARYYIGRNGGIRRANVGLSIDVIDRRGEIKFHNRLA